MMWLMWYFNQNQLNFGTSLKSLLYRQSFLNFQEIFTVLATLKTFLILTFRENRNISCGSTQEI